MLLWDLVRNRYLHKAYVIWLGVFVPAAVVVNVLWDSEWWHAMAPRIMGV
jgi:hypothetical protein